MKTISLSPIGVVHSTQKKAEDDQWDQEAVYIELDETQFTADALMGLAEFSHVEILFHMNQVDPTKIEKTARQTVPTKSAPPCAKF